MDHEIVLAYLFSSFHESSTIPAENLTKSCIADLMLASADNLLCISASDVSPAWPFE